MVGHGGMWAAPGQDPRTGGKPVGELATLHEYLTYFRDTMALKCEGLSPAQLATRSVPPSSMSLLGLIRHLAKVEQTWFQRVLQGRTDEPRLFWTVVAADADFDGAVPDAGVVEQAFAAWRYQIAAADRWLAGEEADVDLADLAAMLPPEQRSHAEAIFATARGLVEWCAAQEDAALAATPVAGSA